MWSEGDTGGVHPPSPPVMFCPQCGITVEDEEQHRRLHPVEVRRDYVVQSPTPLGQRRADDHERWQWTPRRVLILVVAVLFVVIVTGMGVW